MLRPIQSLAERLQRSPFWVKLPIAVMQVVILGILFTWFWITQSVGTVRTPQVSGLKLSDAKEELSKYDLSYRIIRRSSTKTPEGSIIRQVPGAGQRIKETRQLEVYVSKGPELVKVPDLTGKTLNSAKNHLYRQESGKDGSVGPFLNLGNISRVYHAEVPEGKIILQDPKSGRQVIQGSQVDVLVSKGNWPRRTVVPDLKGKNVPEAKSLLRESKLKAGTIHYQLQEDKPPSVVLRQSPSSGIIVQRNRPISLTVNLSETADVAPKKFTFIRLVPPVMLEAGKLKVKLVDRQGSRVVYNKTVQPGKEVMFPVSIRGTAKLIIYWNGEIYRFRRLEYER